MNLWCFGTHRGWYTGYRCFPVRSHTSRVLLQFPSQTWKIKNILRRSGGGVNGPTIPRLFWIRHTTIFKKSSVRRLKKTAGSLPWRGGGGGNSWSLYSGGGCMWNWWYFDELETVQEKAWSLVGTITRQRVPPVRAVTAYLPRQNQR